ncbi:hypothetical protein L804_02038 [Cryptococcus deuterogattii 2001/935-1]|nr:hypothetical protein L804_02038 [Cryptococcus deuterogattii 2001/935-1]
MLTSGIQNSRRDNRQARKCPSPPLLPKYSKAFFSLLKYQNEQVRVDFLKHICCLLEKITAVLMNFPRMPVVLKTKPPPDKEEDPMITKLREKLKLSLQEVRKNAE